MRKEPYYFRDQQGLEVDFLVPRPYSNLWLIEAKAGRTVRSSRSSPLLSLRRALTARSGRLIVVHRKSRSLLPSTVIARGLRLLMQNSSSMNLWAPSSDRVDRGQASLDLFCEVLEISIACHFRLTATRLFFRICASRRRTRGDDQDE